MAKTGDSAVIDKYLPIVNGYYPDVSIENITLFQDGYDHDVLLVNGHQAFRFPRAKDYGKKDRVENIFLPEFTKVSSIKIQEMTGHTDPRSGVPYQMYTFIPGVQFTRVFATTLTEQELVSIAVDMGKFLTALHSFPIARARSMSMDEIDPKTFWKYFEDLYEKIKRKTFPLLSKDEQRWTENLVKEYINVSRDNQFKLVVTHNDLLAEHMLIDEKTHRLSGIIDFSLRIADAAHDFSFFDRYGPLFLETVYKNYPPVDNSFDRRRIFYAGHVPIINLYESMTGKSENMTETHLQELKEYISQTNI